MIPEFHIVLRIEVNHEADACIALLDQWPIVGVWDDERSLTAYLKPADWRNYADDILSTLRQREWIYQIYCLPDENWNAVWEKEFQPIRIEGCCLIRAGFHKAADGKEPEIIIDPEMSFGTGHHETTYMMIEMMSKIPMKQASVLDYGCGTGILSIYALMCQAEKVVAIDIDEKCVRSTKKNRELNNRKDIQVLQGDLDVLQEKSYDIILANINRSVLLRRFDDLYTLLRPDGHLLISGILISDYDLIRQALEKAGFTVDTVSVKGEWLCLLVSKSDVRIH